MGEPEEDKYWIKPGIAVTHVDHEGVVMRVDRVIKTTNKEGRIFIRGVLCNWMDSTGGYQEGTFHTLVLRPYDNNN